MTSSSGDNLTAATEGVRNQNHLLLEEVVSSCAITGVKLFIIPIKKKKSFTFYYYISCTIREVRLKSLLLHCPNPIRNGFEQPVG